MSSYNCLLTNEICKTPCISLFSVAITNYPALGKFKRKECLVHSLGGWEVQKHDGLSGKGLVTW